MHKVTETYHTEQGETLSLVITKDGLYGLKVNLSGNQKIITFAVDKGHLKVNYYTDMIKGICKEY